MEIYPLVNYAAVGAALHDDACDDDPVEQVNAINMNKNALYDAKCAATQSQRIRTIEATKRALRENPIITKAKCDARVALLQRQADACARVLMTQIERKPSRKKIFS